jgi:DNA modification methylase
MKPVELVSAMVENSSRAGENILDPFLGSGTTLIAAEQTGRVCYGMEISPAYVAVTLQRYKDVTGNTPVLT